MSRWPAAGLMAACAAFGLYQWWGGQRIAGGPVDAVPAQADASDAPFEFRKATLQTRARYRIEAKLLSKERYRAGAQGELAPWDFAMGWGPMSRDEVIEQLQVSQSDRFYFYRWTDTPPIDPREIVSHSANMHLIAADAAVASRLDAARAGQKVTLVGRLVDASWPDGYRWTTSLTRDDSGPGACELMFVEAVELSRP